MTASPKTFIFSDQKHTVPGYIYATLKNESSCCGNDAIYLEVKFGADGVTQSAKTLTGKNDCYKKSVIDIVKKVRWDATGVNGSKTIYFEVKPIIPCTGSPQENQYVSLASDEGTVAVVETEETSVETEGDDDMEETDWTTDPVDEVEDEVEEVVTEVEDTMDEVEDEVEDTMDEVEDEVEEAVTEVEDTMDEVEDEVEDAVEETEETVADNSSDFSTEDFLSDGGGSEESSSTREMDNDEGTVVTTTVGGPTQAKKYTGPIKIPPQADMEYESKGERSPDPSHNTTFANVGGQTFSNPKYKEGETQLAIHIRSELRKQKYCGLAQAAFELTVDPAGNVVDVRILAVNDDKVKELIPGIVNIVKFKATNIRTNYRSYHQFKTVLVCDESTKKIDLDNVPNIIKAPVGTP
jgi:ElaB/YqjD/DUF883 family membrane-anchored ribosome-binding protein